MAVPPSSASQALAYIRERLISGEFAAGTRLTEEALDQGEDYFSLMRANLAALREGLECP